VLDKNEIYGKVSYGSFTAVEPGETKTLTFKYKLPQYIKDQIFKKEYKLLVQKQPGVRNVQFVLDMNLGEDFSNIKLNIEKIISSNLSSFIAKEALEKDKLVEISW